MFDAAGLGERTPVTPSTETAITSRIAAFKEISPDLVPQLPRGTITFLAKPPPELEAQTRGLLDINAGDEKRTISQLASIIKNPDLVDVMAQIDPSLEDLSEVVLYLKNWQAFCISHLTNPELTLPLPVRSEADLANYCLTVFSHRPGREEQARTLYQTLSIVPPEIYSLYYSENQNLLTVLSEPAYLTIRNSAETALDLSKNDPELRNQIVSAISEGIQAQEKWWVLDGNGIDPLTKELLNLLVRYQDSAALPIVFDTLFRKVQQDEELVTAIFNNNLSDNPDLRSNTTLEMVLNDFMDIALDSGHIKGIQTELINRHQLTGTASQIVDFFSLKPELHRLPESLGQTRKLNFFGRSFTLEGLPPEADINLKELTNWLIAAYDSSGQILALYHLNPRQFSLSEKEVRVSARRPESLLFWAKGTKQELKPAETRAFFTDYPSLEAQLAQFIPRELLTVIPLPAYFQYWRYLNTLSAQDQDKIDGFIKQCGPLSMFTFLTGEYNQQNIALLADFALKAQEPATYTDEAGIDHVRIYKSFVDSLFEEYSSMTIASWELASQISSDPRQTLEVRELILQRSKALLIAAAKMHQQNGQLTAEEETYLRFSFRFNTALLASLADKTGQTARRLDIPYKIVREFYRLHDPNDPDSRAFFQSASELWLKIFSEKQKTAPYAGRVDEITQAFYEAYDELEADAGQTTADPQLEFDRYVSSLQYDFERGNLPQEATPEKPVIIGYLGIGKGRIEMPLIQHLQAKTHGYVFAGVDFSRSARLPAQPQIEFHKMNMLELGKLQPGRYDRLTAIWSPFMDILELAEIEKAAQSLALALKSGGILELDIAFPFGEHSYEQIVKDYHEAHPDEPEGLMYRDFPRTGQDPIGKLFMASDPALIQAVFGRYFDFDNLTSPAEIETMCRKTSRDDSWITQGPQNNMVAQAVYQTDSGYNRITYRLKRKSAFVGQESLRGLDEEELPLAA